MEYEVCQYLVAFSYINPSTQTRIGRTVATWPNKIDSIYDIKVIEDLLETREGIYDAIVFNITLLDEWTRDTPTEKGIE